MKSLTTALVLLLSFSASSARAEDEVWIERRHTVTPEQGCLAIKALKAYTRLNPGNWIGATVAASALSHAGWKILQSDYRETRALTEAMVDDVARIIEPTLVKAFEAVNRRDADAFAYFIHYVDKTLLTKTPKAALTAMLQKLGPGLSVDLERYLSLYWSSRGVEMVYDHAFITAFKTRMADKSSSARTIARGMAKDLLKHVFRQNRNLLGRTVLREVYGRVIASRLRPTLGKAAAVSAAAIAHGVIIDMVLFPSELGDGTMSGAYAEDPMALIDSMSEEEACRWAKQYTRIGASAVALHEALMLDTGENLADGGSPEVSETLESTDETPAPTLESTDAQVTLAR